MTDLREVASKLSLIDTQYEVAKRMEQITKCFKPGVKITVLVRSPGFPSRDFMMTDDLIPELHAMLDRRDAEAGLANVHDGKGSGQ